MVLGLISRSLKQAAYAFKADAANTALWRDVDDPDIDSLVDVDGFVGGEVPPVLRSACELQQRSS